MRTHLIIRLIILIAMIASCSNPVFAEVINRNDAAINYDALDKLVEQAKKYNSDTLVVMHDGILIGEWKFGQTNKPIELMSVSKSVVCIAIGKMLTDGLIPSLDEPVWKYFPEWRQGEKEKITLRHLLNHSSGIQSNPTTEEIYRSPDFVRLALAAELTSPPGTKFNYNNKAVNLLPAIVKKVTGKTIKVYLKETVFKPMGISSVVWDTDKSGNLQGMAGCGLKGKDLAKLGQLMLNDGSWNGKQILSKSFVDEAVKPALGPNSACGLLWWINWESTKLKINNNVFSHWKENGIDQEILAKLAPLENKEFVTYKAFAEAAKNLASEEGFKKVNAMENPLKGSERTYGPQCGYSANGYLGQYLLVLPAKKLVVARQINSARHISDKDDFSEFFEYVFKLVKAPVSSVKQ